MVGDTAERSDTRLSGDRHESALVTEDDAGEARTVEVGQALYGVSYRVERGSVRVGVNTTNVYTGGRVDDGSNRPDDDRNAGAKLVFRREGVGTRGLCAGFGDRAIAPSPSRRMRLESGVGCTGSNVSELGAIEAIGVAEDGATGQAPTGVYDGIGVIDHPPLTNKVDVHRGIGMVNLGVE